MIDNQRGGARIFERQGFRGRLADRNFWKIEISRDLRDGFCRELLDDGSLWFFGVARDGSEQNETQRKTG